MAPVSPPDASLLQAEGAVDEEKLNELAQYLPISGVIDLVTLFTTESHGHAMRIKNYMAEKNHAAIAREAHNLVSTAGNIGAMQLSATARIVEHACKNGQLDDALLDELNRGIIAANAGFAAWIAAHRPPPQKLAG